MATSYSNPGGTGNRTSLITITTTATLGGGTIDNFIDGVDSSNNSTDAWFWNGGQTLREIELDFTPSGFLQIIDEMQWFQQFAQTHGTWKIQAWNGSSWIDLLTGQNPGGALSVTTHTYSNSTAYLKYKWVQTAGSTSSGPWIQELKLKIEQGAAIGGGVTGTLAATDGADVVAFTGGIFATGSLAATESTDKVHFAEPIEPIGTLVASEGDDVAAMLGVTAGIISSGPLAVTEASDEIAFQARQQRHTAVITILSE